MRRKPAAFLFFIGVFFMFSCNPAQRQIPENVLNLRDANDEQKIKAANDAYIFGYPLVYGETVKNFMTGGSPDFVNKIVAASPDFNFKIFSYPDAQAYYSFVWLDVSKEPVLFEVPAGAGFAVFDAWTNVVLLASNFANDAKILKFAVTSKNWNGFLPQDFVQFRSNTNGGVFICGLRNNKTAVKSYPLSFYGKEYEYAKKLPKPPDTLPLKQIQNMPIEDFYNSLNSLMLANMPFPADEELLSETSVVGVSPGMRFEPLSFSAEVLEKIKSFPTEFAKETVQPRNAWKKMRGGYNENQGYYARAKNAFQNIDGIIDSNAMRIISETSSDGEPFDSSKYKYVLHFEKNSIPQGTWSLTAYDPDGFLMKNSLNRYCLSHKNSLKKNSDGSLNIYIQKDAPQEANKSNWLPIAQKSFKLIFKTDSSNGDLSESTFPEPKKVKAK